MRFCSALVFAAMSAASVAHAADRIPVAVVWMGDATTLDEGRKIVGAVNASLGKSQGARPLDSEDVRALLVDGGPSTQLQLAIERANAAFAKLKFADAAHEYETAEQIAMTDVPVDVARANWANIQRGLLASYDQLGKKAEAARAAERLTFAAGSREDVAALMDRHWVSRAYEPAAAPVTLSVPEGAKVYRNLLDASAPIFGGELELDFVDVELEGFRRGHAALSRGGAITVTLAPEERMSVLVDAIRQKAPEAPLELLAKLAKKTGAQRVLVLAPDGKQVMARYFDLPSGKWAEKSTRAELSAPDAIATYVSPTQAAGTVAKAPAKKGIGKWGKWYTWVAAGGVVALVVTLLVVERVGDDKLTISASH